LASNSESISFDCYSPEFDDRTLTTYKYISLINEKSLVEYLFPRLCQIFLIYELDFEIMSFFRYLRWKMLESYLKHTSVLRRLIERMLGLIALNVKEL